MPRGTMKPMYCTVHGCGHAFRFKREFCASAVEERKKHKSSGECEQRQIAFRKREEEERKASTVTRLSVQNLVDVLRGDLLREIQLNREAVEVLRLRLERRLEGRRPYRDRMSRTMLPKPWNLSSALTCLEEDGVSVREKFKEVILKPQENWNWRAALSCWFHWLLDTCCVDPVVLRRHETIEFYEFGKKVTLTKLQFLPCLKKFRKGRWDRSAVDGFFGSFWLLHTHSLRGMFHWENHILFELRNTTKANAREVRMFDKLFPHNVFEPGCDMLSVDQDLAQLFYHVLEDRRDARKLNRTEDEVYEEDLEEKFSEK